MPQTFVQTSLDELDEPLRLTMFTVVDLETTGGSAASDGITEIGAVRVQGGEILGEFQSLVDPGQHISPFVSVLTGITDAMVNSAPPASAIVASFLEFARGSVLVAHNAPFDIGFLRAACDASGYPWPNFAVVDTAVLARRVLTRDEVPNCKLATLAAYFRAGTQPTHRALADARATVDVLHALIGRLGSIGVQSLPELREFTARVSDAQRRKRHLADGLPAVPGVYVFRDAQGHPLYVGTSRNLRTRVRQYFLDSETRTRMAEMVGLADRVDPIVCAHTLEAQVRELRLIAAHKPRYNRRSKFPERSVWLKLTDEAFPRLSIVRDVRGDAAAYLGPLRTQRQAEVVRDAIHDAVALRQCTDRLSLTRAVRAACALAGIGRCSAPCEDYASLAARAEYDHLVELVRAAWTADIDPLLAPLRRRLSQLSAEQRFEHAATLRDRIATLVRACARMQRLAGLTVIAELVAARPDGAGGWELSVVRHGRLAAAGVAPRGTSPFPVIEALLATADVVAPRPGPLPAALAEETEAILRWLEETGTRPGAHVDALVALCPRCGPPRRLSGHRWRPTRSEPIRRPPITADAGPSRSSVSRCGGPTMSAMITAIVMVSVETDKIPEVAEQLAALDGVSEVYSVAGDVDLVVIVRVREFEQIAEVIAGQLSKVGGVLHTDTHIAFRAYSRHDLDSAFAIGFEAAD